ncbi:hypothetical protein AB6A40_003337 [Gnathostoma spinigerum]|uniref:Uncharacterized protein n=1 Tax=Gnathostoma spinigerum TaxID=75299 RepID=A0ABD6E994_9BILA
MAEESANTSNHQRLEEMFLHLTPRGAIVPYSVCIDEENSLWVAAKGGLFKFSSCGQQVLFERKNEFPKKISPYCQVLHLKRKIIYAFAEDKLGLTEFRIFNLNGDMEHEQFIDGKVVSLDISENGDIFMTKQPQGEDSIIYRATLDCPLDWEELISDDEWVYQALCVYDSKTLLASAVRAPVNMYSKQQLRWINIEKEEVAGKFSENGKEGSTIYFPRAIQRYHNDVLVLDKTGRILRFTRDSKFVGVAAKIDAYLGNGFTVENDQAVIVCSGIVIDRNNESICDDWVEKVSLAVEAS